VFGLDATEAGSWSIPLPRVLASQVEALLLEEFPRVQVTARDGEVFVNIHTGLSTSTLLTEKQKIIAKVESIAIGLGGAEKVHVAIDS
jgi:hypothetical protein